MGKTIIAYDLLKFTAFTWRLVRFPHGESAQARARVFFVNSRFVGNFTIYRVIFNSFFNVNKVIWSNNFFFSYCGILSQVTFAGEFVIFPSNML